MNLMQACSRVRKDRESGFHDCGVAEYRVQACLSSGYVRLSHVNHRRGLVKLVEAHFSVRKDGESSFQHSGGAE